VNCAAAATAVLSSFVKVAMIVALPLPVAVHPVNGRTRQTGTIILNKLRLNILLLLNLMAGSLFRRAAVIACSFHFPDIKTNDR
jgi:hypothetical protein